MTESELAAYRQQISQMLQQPEKVICNSGLQNFTVRTFNFEQSVLKLLGLQQLPVAVNCSRHREACSDEELLSMVGPHGMNRPVQPVRQYQWGTVYPLAREHQSDILPLKRLLLGDQVNTLYAMLEDSHKRYVAFSEEFAEYGEELQALAQDMYCLIKPLEYDDYPVVRANLTKVQAAKRELQEANKQLLEKIKKAEAERKALKERVWKG
jgi:septin family protein